MKLTIEVNIFFLIAVSTLFMLETSCFTTGVEDPKPEYQFSHSDNIKRYILDTSKLVSFVSMFNNYDDELYTNLIPNSEAIRFLSDNIPLIDLPDSDLEQTYYFRWWTYRKHIKRVSLEKSPYVITEFLAYVPWSGRYNTISCAAGHHFREGRWIHNSKYLESYAKFWFQGELGGNPRAYSFWPASSIWLFYSINGNEKILSELFNEFVRNFRILSRTNFDSKLGLFYNTDNRDGMELSAGSEFGARAYRPTLNSYMIAEAKVIASLASILNISTTIRDTFTSKADSIFNLMEEYLWDSNQSFYKALPIKSVKRNSKAEELNSLVPVRELHGYTPWYFNIPEKGSHLEAWSQIIDNKGFNGPCGLTTAEQRHPLFAIEYSKLHECRWNGPTWPYATSITLTALANVLQDPEQPLTHHSQYISKQVYFNLLKTYSKSHHRVLEPGDKFYDFVKQIPWIDENINPFTGDWISRTLLKTWANDTWSNKKGGRERGKDYNHSTFTDLILSGLLGFYPVSNSSFEIRHLIPEDPARPGYLIWKHFCVDQLKYRGKYVTIVYDESGEKYGIGKGLKVMVNGIVAKSERVLHDRVIVTY